jgi:hypothetical protein
MEDKIFARSPYYIAYTSGSTISTAELKIWIYGGSRSTGKPTNPEYTLSKSNVSATEVFFEVSELVREFFDHSLNETSFEGSGLWVYYELSTNGTQRINTTLFAIDGYNYFEDGANADKRIKLAQDTDEIVTKDDYNITIPVSTDDDGVASVTFLYKGNAVADYQFSVLDANADSDVVINYAIYGEGTYQQRVKANGGTIEDSSCLRKLLKCIDLSPCDTIYVAGRDGKVQVIKVTRDNNGLQEAKEVTFINRYGAKQQMTFLRNSTTRIGVTSDSYNKVLGSISGTSYAYDTTKHNRRTYNVKAEESITLNSGFVPESYDEVIRQLLMSEYVWLDGKPVMIVTKEQQMKTQLKDKLINYTIDFKYANDIINNVI